MAQKTKIRILPESVVNKIAAGEVVDRPASVVKELTENSLDAGSRTIGVRLDGASGRLISVTDDGCGFSPDDAFLAFERHSTSKISNSSEIENVSTLGFRGEALPSIAAVSHLTLATRRVEDETGIKLDIIGGSVKKSGSIAMPSGTTVTVRRLFYNTPVRKKFLRSQATEKSHLVKSFLKLALAFPDVRMTLEYNGNKLYTLPAGNMEQRIKTVFSGEVINSMFPLKFEAGGIQLEGYIADPYHPPPGSCQYFFVNRRPVEDRLLYAAIREGLARRSGRPRKLDFILFLSLDPGQMDVNVHPAKKEVRFSQPSRILNSIAEGISKTLEEAVSPRKADSAFFKAPDSTGRTGQPHSQQGKTESIELAAEQKTLIYTPEGQQKSSTGEDTGNLSCIGQIMGGYILAEGPEGLMLIDQHAAHERILFEKVLHRFTENRQLSQSLLWPEEFEIPPHDYQRIVNILPDMAKTGCRMEPFGPQTFRVLSLPPEIGISDVRNFIKRLIDLFDETDETMFSEPSWWEKPAALIACHGAVKMGEELKRQDMSQLISDLMACKDSRHCPHGRPTMVVLERREIEKLFGRR